MNKVDLNAKIKTVSDLALAVLRLRYESGLAPQNRRAILLAGIRYGLLKGDLTPTPKYFALMSDEAEKLARQLTAGWKDVPATMRKIAANDRALLGLEPEQIERRRHGGFRKNAGRPSIHPNGKARQRAYRERKRAKSRMLRNQAKFINVKA